MSITRETIKSTLRSIMAEESEYQTFFKKALEKAGKSIPSMSDEEKKEFFNKIDAAWNAKGEKNEELKGNQHKLDVDGDGEIEASDLAALRAGKKKEESVNEAPIFFNKQFRQATSDLAKSKSEKDSFTAINKETGNVSTFKSKDAKDAAIKAGTHKNESIEESTGCGCGCGCGGSKMNEEFKSKSPDFEKVYALFDKKDYFNAKGLAKVQIGNFERALQRNDKGAQQILDKFKGDMDKAKEYITQVISDQKKEQAYGNYMELQQALADVMFDSNDSKVKAGVDFIKIRVHNNSQKYTMALYSALRKKKFTNYKDVHADIDSLVNESITEGRAFINAARKAKAEGKTEFEFNGKTYPVTLKESLNEDANMNKKVKQLLDKNLKELTKGKPNHQFAVMHILMGALSDANFHSEAKQVAKLFPKAKYEGDPMAAKDVEEYYHYELGPDVANICKWDGKDIVMAMGFYISMTIGRPLGQKVETLVESLTEARLGKVSLLKSVEKGETSRVEGVKISPDLAFELRMFLQRPMLARTRTGIAIDNAQMKDAIGMLAKVGVHKRLSSGVKKEFAELLKKYNK